MVVAVAGMHVVKVTGDEIVDVVAVWHGGMAAVHAVHVLGVMITTRVIGRAPGRVRGVDGYRALVDVIAVYLVEVTVVQVVDMVGVTNSGMTTGGSMDVIVAVMSGVRHCSSVG